MDIPHISPYFTTFFSPSKNQKKEIDRCDRVTATWGSWLTLPAARIQSFQSPVLGAISAVFNAQMLHGAGIFTYIWLISGLNVGKYSIHGAYGMGYPLVMTHSLRTGTWP